MSNKMIKCQTCGQDIASTAKSCTNCGAKVKKPIYKKWWFWVIIVVIVSGVIGGTSGENGDSGSSAKVNTNSQQAVSESNNSDVKEISYTEYDVTELLDAVKTNALKAQNDLKGQYVEIHGYLSNVDSDGNYISVGASKNNYNYLLRYIHCNIKYSNKDEITNKVVDMNIDDAITVKGKITDVGEVLGIFLDIDSIE